MQIVWGTSTVPMRHSESIQKEDSCIQYNEMIESPSVTNATTRLKQILDAKYEPADLDKTIASCVNLTTNEKQSLSQLLYKYQHVFDGTLGQWRSTPYNIQLKENVTPYHAKPFPIPKVHEQTLLVELNRLCSIGVLKKINRSEWAAPTFIIPKKDGSVRFISDFRELNKRIKRQPFPIPKIQDLLLKLEGFQYATSLDLNMGYYHIVLSPMSKRLCTIVTPYGKYEYQRLPMGLCNSPDIFQEKISHLMQGLEFVRAYIDDVLLTSSGDWNDHIHKLDQVLNRISRVGLKINALKSFFGKTEIEYLGFWITRTGIRPLIKKVEAMRNIAPPKTKKELRRFIGLVNYYRDMWARRSETLAPLTRLTSKTVPWKWTDIEQKAFIAVKAIISKETLLSYPDFSSLFEIHTDASKAQLGSVISQQGHPIAFYSRKLNPAQTNYTTTERELLSIVETLKEFRNILLGQQILIHTDHLNLTYKTFNTERVMRWRLLIEEFNPTFQYIKGDHNIVADALSRLPLINDTTQEESQYTLDKLAECFATALDPTLIKFPLKFQVIHKYQQADKTLKTTQHQLKSFHGGDIAYKLMCHNDKIIVPKPLQKYLIEWYHQYLLHPGMNRTEETIKQHFWWNSMQKDIIDYVSRCSTCQRSKKQRKKYGHLPIKVAETNPWKTLCVDLIGPYTIKRKGQESLRVQCCTMIDPATGWFEIASYDDKRSITIANIVEQTWLSRYPWPTQLIFDRGSEFMGHEFKQMITEDYGIKQKPITVRNPQANAIIERVHQTIGNMIRTFNLEENLLDNDDPWSGILSATAFAVRSTYHTTLRATPGQLVFGRDMILNIQHIANWKAIQDHKQMIINKNNQRENAKRLAHVYHIGDQVLLDKDNTNKYENPYEGPYTILQVNTNGTVRLQMGAVIDTVNIRRLHPYKT
jgi:transposase InsO family protein